MKRVVVAVLALAACKGSDAPQASTPPPSAGPVAAPPKVAGAIDAAPIAPPVSPDAAVVDAGSKVLVRDQLRDDGVGMITAKTGPTTFKEMFPTVKVTNDSAEDHDFDRYQVGKDLEAITNNEKSGFFKVTVWGHHYQTLEGISPGSTVAQLAAAYPDAQCKFETYAPNAEDFTRALYCTTAKYPHLGFYLDDAKWKGKPGAVAVATIATRTVDRVLWVPKVEE